MGNELAMASIDLVLDLECNGCPHFIGNKNIQYSSRACFIAVILYVIAWNVTDVKLNSTRVNDLTMRARFPPTCLIQM